MTWPVEVVSNAIARFNGTGVAALTVDPATVVGGEEGDHAGNVIGGWRNA